MGKLKVAVAMSGGVDSSVTASLLKERGFNVMGVTMRLSKQLPTGEVGKRSCCPEDALEDARRVSEVLGIPHYVADFRESFKKNVIDKFLDDYIVGKTPNPCIECNRHLKFGLFFEKAMDLGADYIATGHYARIKEIDGKYRLCKGVDVTKDQSYVLYPINIDYLSRILFPLGEYSKDEVRIIAEKFNLPVAHKSDSQEICFIPKDDYKTYLKQNRGECLKSGDIVDINGNVLGKHEGVGLYTIGQRKGLGISSGAPLYVTELDVENNRVIVGRANDVFANGLVAEDVNWLDESKKNSKTFKCKAKIRYQHKEADCNVEVLPDNTISVVFDSSQRAITRGQAVVLYENDMVIGGGRISQVNAD